MGIKQLSKLIKEKCPRGVVSRKYNYFGSSKIAIDASLCIYQFLIAVRSDGMNLGFNDEATSHIIGMFYRTIKMVEAGIVPVYVFDGKAPAMKVEELKKRLERREKADKLFEIATGLENKEEMVKQEKRKVKVEQNHVDDCRRLLKLMGIPYITAVSESEAYCSFLCKQGAVKAVATEDMDALCFGAPYLLRNLNASQAKKLDIDEYNLNEILKGLDISMNAFIDLCILMGCDYCDTIKGVGYKRAFEFIKKHGCIEEILKSKKFEIPNNFDYLGARSIFKELGNIGEVENFKIDFDNMSVDGLVEYLCKEKGFDEKRVRSGMERIIKTKGRGVQKKISDFFGAK